MSGPGSLVGSDEEEQTNYHTPDETGLTKSQKVALIAAWSIVKKDLVTHGRNIFVM